MRDPAFLAESERIKAEISPTTGEEMQQLIAEIIDAPADVRARAKRAMELSLEDSRATKAVDKAVMERREWPRSRRDRNGTEADCPFFGY